MNLFCKYLILLFLTIFLAVELFAQGDSAQSRKNEIGFGTPMFPFLYNSIGGLGLGENSVRAPRLGTNVMRPSFFFFPIKITYARLFNAKNRFRIGLDISHSKHYFNYYEACAGLQHKLSKAKKKVSMCFNFDISVGSIRFSRYYDTGGNHNIGTIEDGSIFLVGLNTGVSMQYAITDRFLIESEIMLKGYKGKVKGFVYDTSYFDDKKPIMLSTYGMLFARLLGLHLVYKF